MSPRSTPFRRFSKRLLRYRDLSIRALRRMQKRADRGLAPLDHQKSELLTNAKQMAKMAAKYEQATKYEYYWYKAYKRLDIRDFEGFGPLAAKAVAEHRTGMKQDRLYTLWQAVAGLAPGNHPIVEVGAYQGGSARFIGEALQWHGRDNAFFVCDTFQGHAVVDERRALGTRQLGEPRRVVERFP